MTTQSIIRIAAAGLFDNSVATFLLTGFLVILVILPAFIATLIYASVIYHRHRRNVPYHRSQPNPSSDIDRNKGTYTDSELGVSKYPAQPENRDSSSAPEIDAAGGDMSKRLMGEMGSDAERSKKWIRTGSPMTED